MNRTDTAPRLGTGRELALLTLLFLGMTALFLLVIYPLAGWPRAAPIPARSVVLAVAILALLRHNGETLASIGLARPRRRWPVPLLACALVAFQILAIQPFTDWLRPVIGATPADYGIFAHIHGNVPAYLGWIVVAWVAGGFAEEMIFRGYLINRLAAAAGGGAVAVTLAIVLQAALFGAGHLYLGLGTGVNATVGALARGAFFVAAGRNLWPLVLAHGLWDTLGFTVFFVDGVPAPP